MKESSPSPLRAHPDRRHHATRTQFALMRVIFDATGEISPD
jgi:hypothetical protein